MFPILERCETGMLFKFPEKIPQVIETAVQTDIHDGFICGLKENDGLLDPILIDIGDRGFPQDFFVKAAEVLFVHIGIFSKIPYINLVLIMISDKFKRRLDDPDTVIICFFGMGQQRKGRKDSQDLQKSCADKKLRCYIFGDGFVLP